jgi:hypothetical protein
MQGVQSAARVGFDIWHWLAVAPNNNAHSTALGNGRIGKV